MNETLNGFIVVTNDMEIFLAITCLMFVAVGITFGWIFFGREKKEE